MSSQDKNNLTAQILIAMVMAIIVGLAINLLGLAVAEPPEWFSDAAKLQPVSQWLNEVLVGSIFMVIGKIFVSCLKMMVVPLVLVSLVGGVTALGDPKALGRIGGKAVGLYLVTTALAISLALLLATLIGPGVGTEATAVEKAAFTAKEQPGLAQVLIDMVPTNPIAAMADGKMLQIIVFALLLGVAISLVGERGKTVLQLFEDLNAIIMQMVIIIMKLAPIGVFCLLAKTLAELGLGAVGQILTYFLTVFLALMLHAFGSYMLILRVLGGLSPLMFIRKMRPALMFAFSTASSNATIPVTQRTVTERLGVKNKVASFTVPLGATINMDGTAIMQGVATVFIANVYGINLSFADFMTVIATATLASIGTAGVPGVGLIMLALVLEQVGLPVEGIAMIIGIDRLLDMARTAVNITGDAMVSCLIGKSEQAFDQDCFNDPKAGQIETQ